MTGDWRDVEKWARDSGRLSQGHFGNSASRGAADDGYSQGKTGPDSSLLPSLQHKRDKIERWQTAAT